MWPVGLLGCGSGILFYDLTYPWVWAGGMAASLLAVLVSLRFCWSLPWLLPALTIAAGALAGHSHAAWLTEGDGHRFTTPMTAVVDEIRQEGNRYRIRLRPDQKPNHLMVKHVWRLDPVIKPGSVVLVHNQITRLSPQMNPGGYDPQSHGAHHDESWRYRGPLIFKAPGSSLRSLAYDIHQWARRKLDGTPHRFGASVLKGILLGDRKAVPESAIAGFQDTGTGHVLAVSGLHIAGASSVVFYILLWVLSLLRFTEPVRWAMLGSIPIAIIMVLMAQSPLSAIRSAAMLSLYLGGRLLGRQARSLDLWSVVGLILLLEEPSLLQSAGFQLSFAAVGALIILGQEAKGVLGFMWVCLVASWATAPILGWHFAIWTPASPLGNAIVVPLVTTLVVPIGLLGLVCHDLSTIPLEWASELATMLVCLTEVLADLFGSSWSVERRLWPLLWMPLLLMFVARFSSSKGLRTLSFCLPLCFVQSADFHGVEFLYVGQGDAILIRSGDEAALVDAGPDPKAWAVRNALKRAGVERLRWVLITHGHPDHFAGLVALYRTIKIDVIRYNGRALRSRAWGAFMRKATASGVRFMADRGTHWTLGQLRIRSLRPMLRTGTSENNASMATLIEGTGGRALLTGDIERAAEVHLLKQFTERVDVLQAPHHGSSTSSHPTLIETLQPSHAVVSVGRNNRHNLPRNDVIERYRDAGATVWRTDLDGRIRVQLSPVLKVESYRLTQGAR